MTRPKSTSPLSASAEAEIVDYAAGKLSEQQRLRFEARLEGDTALQHGLAQEMSLRAALHEYQINHQVSDLTDRNGLDVLLSEIKSIDRDAAQSKAPVAELKSRNWLVELAVAASLVLAVSMLVMTSENHSTEDYKLLTQDQSAGQMGPNFNQLVESNRVAQVWFIEGLSESALNALFASNQLKPIGRAGLAWIVTAPSNLTDADITRLNAQNSILKASLISFQDTAAERP